MARPPWEVSATSTDAHVVPIGDLVMHEVDPDCVCIPEVTPVECDDGSIGYVYTHAAFDGRE